MKSWLLSGLLTVACGATLGAPSSAAAEVIDRIAARVNEHVVTLSDLVRLMPVYMQVVGVDPSRLRTSEGRDGVASELLGYLVDTHLLTADAEERGLGVTAIEVEEYLAAQRERLGISEAEFAAELEAQGVSMEDFREFMTGNLTRARILQLDVAALVDISDEEVDREVATLYPDGLVETFITTRHVLVQLTAGPSDEQVAAAMQRAADLRAEIVAGRPFEDVAAQVNPDASRGTGGRIGTFSTFDLDQDYVRAALALEPGEISDPVRTQFGVHLILLEALERRPVDDAEDIRARVAYELESREADRQMGAYLSRLRDDAFVEIRVTEFNL